MAIQPGHQLLETKQLAQLVLPENHREILPDPLPALLLILRKKQEVHQGGGAERMPGRLSKTCGKRGDNVNGIPDPGRGHRAGAGNDICSLRGYFPFRCLPPPRRPSP